MINFFSLLGKLFTKRSPKVSTAIAVAAEDEVEMNVFRSSLVSATGLTSSYKKKKDPSQRWDVSVFQEGANITQDMFDSLVELAKATKEQQGTLYVTDLFRSWKTQEANRNDYLSGKKKAFVAPPGGSFHQAGRAVDFSTSELNFQGVSKENWLKKFWDLSKPLGFYPIIKIPDLGVSECWHFDFPGKDWEKAYEYMDDYSSDCVDYGYIAKCCILDVGKWNPKEKEEKVRNMVIQAQLVRLGHYKIGAIDGIIGKKTKDALRLEGLGDLGLNFVAEELIKK